ncbi:hypothetical protein [Streptomyces cuspidosporus]|uniref:Uncharacterized protein n=1 Tax=Streptomyces cuspidosporus TaxID=66882 RepID=A0ABN3H9K9_9ACTN
MLKAAGGLALAGAAGGLTAAVTAGPADAAPATFTHPGMLHAYGELNRAKVRVAAGDDPWLAGWNRLTANAHAQSGWKPNPQATIIRGGTGENYGILYNDIHAAYQNALRWKIAGTTAHGDTARDILNAWSAKLTTVTGNADRFLAAGIYGYQFAGVPFTTYTWGTGQNCAQQSQTVISSASRGQARPVWDILHYHYARRRGLSVPYITAMAEKGRPEGGGGDYGSTSGGFDQLGFGTLLYAK